MAELRQGCGLARGHKPSKLPAVTRFGALNAHIKPETTLGICLLQRLGHGAGLL
jgi:hypothetical protein